MRLRIISPDGATSERDVSGSVIRLGRDPACEISFDSTLYPQVSGLHARLEQTSAGLTLTPLSRSNKTLLNDQPVEGPTAIRLGDRMRLSFTGPIIEVLALDAIAAKPASASKPPALRDPTS